MTTFDPRTVHSTSAQQFGTPRTGQFGAQGFPGQQFPGPVPPPPSRPSRTRRPLAAKIIAGFIAAGVVVGGAGTWLAVSGSPAEAAVQSTSFAGANPTTNPFGTDAPQVAAVAATGPQAGDTTGLYAATTPPACTTADFLSQLQADPAKLAAFGGVYGLGAGDVPAFVNSLSPVVLRANTSVTDHPFTDGAFVPQPAVLAAGTAVLVNSYGEPTVKCFNGNPLTGGAPVAGAISVLPTDQVITSFQFTSIDNSRVVVIPGKPDPKPNKGHNPDPFLQAKADAAKQLAENARKDATAARADATQAAQAQKDAQTRLDEALTTFQQAADAFKKAQTANPFDQAAFDIAQRNAIQAAIARDAAVNGLKTATDAATAADTKAKGLEDKATADEQAAAKAKQEAEDSEHPHQKDADPTKDEGQAPAAQQGQQGKAGQQGQQPATVTKSGTVAQKCQGVVADNATAITPATCGITGSADSATGTAPATGGEKTSKTAGSDTTSSSNTSTGTSASTSKGESKEGTGK